LAVTLAAAVIPAVRASRTAPVAAMRDAAVDRSRHPAVRLLAATPFLVVAGLLLRRAFALVGEESAPGWALLAAVPAVGALAVAGPVLAPPVATVASAPFRWLFGITGRLAGRNAVRNPTRTSSTACALVIGVALVCAIGVLASSLSTTVEGNVDRTMAGDFMVVGGGFGGFSPAVADALRPVPGVAEVVDVRGGPLEVAGRRVPAVAADQRALGAVVPLDVSEGSLDRLGPGAIALSRDQADAAGVTVGQRVPLRFLRGQEAEAEVVAVYERSLTPSGEYLLDQAFWDANLPPSDRTDQRVLITVAPGAAPGEVQGRLVEAATAVNPAAEVLDVAGYRERQVGRVMQRITYLYALLALSVIVGVLGIVNTLLLSVHERAREIGLLRCVGTRRRQIAGAVLQEAVLIAAPGAVFGVLFGVVVGWAVVRTVRLDLEMVFVVPVRLLVIVALASGVAGLLAGLYPAWRAGRMPVSNLLSME
jgi:putative ABC transport system permease protein